MDVDSFIKGIAEYYSVDLRDCEEGYHPHDLRHLFGEITELKDRIAMVVDINKNERQWSERHLTTVFKRTHDLRCTENYIIASLSDPSLSPKEKRKNMRVLESQGIHLSQLNGKLTVHLPEPPEPESYIDCLERSILELEYGDIEETEELKLCLSQLKGALAIERQKVHPTLEDKTAFNALPTLN